MVGANAKPIGKARVSEMRYIDMHQIEIFLMVAHYQNISRAAQELFISQPAISNWINKMEADCGMTLFTRTNRGVSLTPEGANLYARLDIAYHRFRVSVAEICQGVNDPSDTLRIGYLHRREICDTAEQALHAYSAQYPDIKINSEMYNFHELRDKLLCDELDLVVTVSYDIAAYPEFDFRTLKPFSTFFSVSKEWKALMDAGPGLSFLNQKALILEARTAQDKALAICAANGFEPSEIKYVNSYLMMTTLIDRGVGFSICGDFGEKDFHYPQTIFIPVERGNDADIVVAWCRGKLTPLAEKFLEALSAD